MTAWVELIRGGWPAGRYLVWLTAMLCIASAISTQPLLAQNTVPGSVDPSFAAPQIRDVDFVIGRSNGHLLVAGRFTSPGTNLVRLTADGAYDPTFAPTIPSGVTALALQPDGKLLAGSKWGNGLRRLLPDGSLDSSFNFVPPYIHPRILDFYFWTTALAVQPDGRILVAGYRIYDSRSDERYYWTAALLYRLLPDGSLDSTFTPFPATVRALAVLPDQRILVVGGGLTVLHPDGGRDTNFVAGPFSPGIDSADLSLDDTFATTINCFAIQPDGRILVGGSFTNVQGHARSRLARVLADGQLDLSFDPDPPPFTSAGFPQPTVKALAVQTDGRILVGGISDVRSIARLNPDGSLDGTFAPFEGLDEDEDARRPSAILIQDRTRALIGGGNLDPGDLFRIHLGERVPPLCEGFCITSFNVQPNSVTITWRSQPGETYYIESKASLADPNWTIVSGGIIAQGTQASWTGLRPSGTSAFYRVARLTDGSLLTGRGADLESAR